MASSANRKCVHVLSKITGLCTSLKNILPDVVFIEIELNVTESCITTGVREKLKGAEVIVADFDLLGPHLYNLPVTKWVQGTWAGVDKLLPFLNLSKPNPPYKITRFSGKNFGNMMSEYVIAHIVGHERNFAAIIENQKECNWNKDKNILTHRTIADLTVGLFGHGGIGKEVARNLKSFGASVWVLVRNVPEKGEKSAFVDQFREKCHLPEFLAQCDYICNLMPSTPETKGFLSGGVLKNCKPGAVFMNIGRGDVIGENDIIIALSKGWISAAILDVFEEEPLPPNSPLWKNPKVTITPHVAAVSRPKDIAEAFKHNYEKYCNGEELDFLLNLNAGY